MDTLLGELCKIGVDTEDALHRFMGNASLYEKMLRKFDKTAEQLEVMSYLQNGDYEIALNNAHSFKGVAGNLSLTPLFEGYSKIVLSLRGNDPEQAKAELERILPIQKNIVDCITRNKEQIEG